MLLYWKPQIVTCSGGSNSGSLNVVRTGADFQELAILREIPDISNIWPIRRRYEDSSVCLFVLPLAFIDLWK